MKTVDAKELSKFKMTSGNEKKYSSVIDDGTVKDWVGFGWIENREATEGDYKNLPVVVR